MSKDEQEMSTGANESAEIPLRPLTRSERRNLWLQEYDRQDIALQSWVRLAEQQALEIELMLQMQGLLVFGTLVSTASYARFYIDMHEEMYRANDPETADFLRDYYVALVPPDDQPEIGPEGLPTLHRFIHLRDVSILSAGHKVKLPYWRGQLREVSAFVVGAQAGD